MAQRSYSILLISFRWLVIAVGLVRAYLARGSYHGLYYSIEKPLKFFQTGALLEVSDMRAIQILIHLINDLFLLQLNKRINARAKCKYFCSAFFHLDKP